LETSINYSEPNQGNRVWGPGTARQHVDDINILGEIYKKHKEKYRNSIVY
jgi:hypothetical protein